MSIQGLQRQSLDDNINIEDEVFNLKKRRIEEENDVDINFDDCDEYLEAVRVLEKKREDMLALVNSQLRLAIEDANNLAEFEKQKVEERFQLQTEEIQKQEIENHQIRTRSMTSEDSKQRYTSKSETTTTQTTNTAPYKKDQCCYSVVLKEDEMVADLIMMSHSTQQMCKQLNIPAPCTVAPLSYNRLLLNDHVITPKTPCSIRTGGMKMYDCEFLWSTIVKEKEMKEKKKEPEFAVRVSATRKRRFPIESLRNGEMELIFREEDLQSAGGNHGDDSYDHGIYNYTF